MEGGPFHAILLTGPMIMAGRSLKVLYAERLIPICL
jgi:hypothetical protein